MARNTRNSSNSGAAGDGAGNGGAAQVEMGQVLGVLAQILERLVPQPAMNLLVPNVPPAVPEVPSYLTVMDHMLKLGTKYFSGGAKPIEADEWRSWLERNFSFVRCPQEYRKDIAVHYLADEAHTWWLGVANRLPNPNCSWETFRDLFHAKYFPQEARDRLETEFLDLRQGTLTRREYEAKFNRLKRYGGHEMEEEQVQVCRFLRGMRIDVRNLCMIRNYATLSELVEKAAMLEDVLAEEAKMVAKQVSTPTVPQGKLGNGAGQKKSWGKKGFLGNPVCSTCKKVHSGTCRLLTRDCLQCGSRDHKITDCPERERVADTRVCYNCGDPGHLRPNCPKLG
ncbi:PREDICTED: uncharacterized protein LOC104715950 [Camelina sativa]|uniref:Uncharacterized protein LOC104715950 n=1 Tax=Camelina sativa TaxID=90675 RepID=A0ABM0TUF4_CAMSA|nr:PREDICTED: uncharacterized protein LOC104715950 [Camelina sativa]